MNFFAGLALLMLVNSVVATVYCRPGLCQRGTHIACRNPGTWGEECGSNPKLYPLSAEDKQFILDLHNKHRQEVASGSLPRYEPAANMSEVIWNDELASVACFNCKTCIFGHDDCRNTDDHPYSGQNIAIVGQSMGFKSFREAYEDLHNKWYAEHKYCDMNNIRSYKNQPTEPNQQIGHFTQMVADNVDQVGCCVSMYEKEIKNGGHNTKTSTVQYSNGRGGSSSRTTSVRNYNSNSHHSHHHANANPKKETMKFVLIVCNYSYISITDRPIYVAGRPRCRKFSNKYKSLCIY